MRTLEYDFIDLTCSSLHNIFSIIQTLADLHLKPIVSASIPKTTLSIPYIPASTAHTSYYTRRNPLIEGSAPKVRGWI